MKILTLSLISLTFLVCSPVGVEIVFSEAIISPGVDGIIIEFSVTNVGTRTAKDLRLNVSVTPVNVAIFEVYIGDLGPGESSPVYLHVGGVVWGSDLDVDVWGEYD